MKPTETPEFTPEFPAQGERLAPHHRNAETLALLSRRRSTAAVCLRDPGPSPEELDCLLQIAARVPDHGKMAPWRFLLFQGEDRAHFGEVLAKIWASENEEDATRLALESRRFLRAPVVIGVVSRVLEKHKIPEWEQILSAGAVCQNLLIAAQAMGFGSQWLTEWYAYHPQVKDTLGLRSGERIAGFIYIGSTEDEPVERVRPSPEIGIWRG